MSDLIEREQALKALRGVEARTYAFGYHNVYEAIRRVPSAESDDWLEKNKDLILQAGMEGREVEFRIGGRLFAIREKAQ